MFYLRRKIDYILCIGLIFICIIIAFVLPRTSATEADTSSTETPYTITPTPINTVQIPTDSNIVVVLKDSPILFSDVIYKVNYTIDSCNSSLVQIRLCVFQLRQAIKSDSYTTEACDAMFQEINRLEAIAAQLNLDIEKITNWENEYYYATKTWQFLTSHGYSEVISSAIIGNMMIETSGGSLGLKPSVYNPSGNFYGLCQWSLKYYPEVKDLSFKRQLDYLVETIQWELDTFGENYKRGFKYEDFLTMTNPAEAALAFAKAYERCGTGSYKMRQEAAEKAYEYFDLHN